MRSVKEVTDRLNEMRETLEIRKSNVLKRAIGLGNVDSSDVRELFWAHTWVDVLEWVLEVKE